MNEVKTRVANEDSCGTRVKKLRVLVLWLVLSLKTDVPYLWLIMFSLIFSPLGMGREQRINWGLGYGSYLMSHIRLRRMWSQLDTIWPHGKVLGTHITTELVLTWSKSTIHVRQSWIEGYPLDESGGNITSWVKWSSSAYSNIQRRGEALRKPTNILKLRDVLAWQREHGGWGERDCH